MFSNHRILFPVDFSKRPFAVPQAAREVIDRPNIEIVLLHVIDGGVPSASEFADRMEYLDLLARRHFSHSVVIRRLDHGRPAERILDYLHKSEIEMAVIHARESDGFGKGSLGRVANRILAEADCPVWLEWRPARHKKLAPSAAPRICCAIDGVRQAQELIRDATIIADRLNGDLTVISSIQPGPKGAAALFRGSETGGEEVLCETERIGKLRRRIAPWADVRVAAGWREAVIGHAVRDLGGDLLITGDCREAVLAAEGTCPVLRLPPEPGRIAGLCGNYRGIYRSVA